MPDLPEQEKLGCEGVPDFSDQDGSGWEGAPDLPAQANQSIRQTKEICSKFRLMCCSKIPPFTYEALQDIGHIWWPLYSIF